MAKAKKAAPAAKKLAAGAAKPTVPAAIKPYLGFFRATSCGCLYQVVWHQAQLMMARLCDQPGRPGGPEVKFGTPYVVDEPQLKRLLAFSFVRTSPPANYFPW